MPTDYVSLSLTRLATLGDAALIRLLLEAAERAGCIPGEIIAAGMVIEAEPVSLAILETSVRELLRGRGAELDSFTVRRI